MLLITKMRNVAGLSTSDAQKSTDLFTKTRYMDELTTKLHGRPCGTIFASGTPVYTLQLLKKPINTSKKLKQTPEKNLGICFFDSIDENG